MQIGLDPEQRAFAEVCGKLAADLAAGWTQGRGPDEVGPAEPDAAAWRRVADAGWLGLGLDEREGGAGGSVVDLAVLAEQLGRHTVPAPVLGTILAAEQLRAAGADSALLGRVAAGALRVAPLLRADLTAFAAGPPWVAWDAAGATLAVALDGTGHRPGTPLAAVDLTRQARELAGPADQPPTGLTRPDQAGLDRLIAFGLTLACADLLGVMSAALDDAVAHATSRTQFGVPIGSFQAVQQIAADSLVSVEASRSAVYYAAWAVDAQPAEEAVAAARAAKAFVAPAAVAVCESAVQVLGGIGMTWESPAHVRLRRAHASRALLGDEHHQRELLTDRIIGRTDEGA